MSSSFREIDSLEDNIQDEFRTYARLLLHRQHIFENKEKSAYKFITDDKYIRIMTKLMSGCGYDLLRLERIKGNGLVGIVPMSDLSFNKIKRLSSETVKVLIALYKVYVEQGKSGEIDQNGCVEASLDELALVLNSKNELSEYRSILKNIEIINELGIIESLEKVDRDTMMRVFKINQSIEFYVTETFIHRWEHPEDYREDGTLIEKNSNENIEPSET